MSVTHLRLMTRNCAKTFRWMQKSDILWAADVPDPSLERSRHTATVVTHTLGPCPVHSTAITCNYCTTKIHPAHHRKRKAHCRVEATDPDHAKLKERARSIAPRGLKGIQSCPAAAQSRRMLIYAVAGISLLCSEATSLLLKFKTGENCARIRDLSTSRFVPNDEDNGDSVFRGWVGLRTQVVGTNIAVHIKLVTPHPVRFTN